MPNHQEHIRQIQLGTIGDVVVVFVTGLSILRQIVKRGVKKVSLCMENTCCCLLLYDTIFILKQ